MTKLDRPWSPTTDQRGVWEFEQLAMQPFDGLIGLHQPYQFGNLANYPYTICAQKTCTGGLVRDTAGSRNSLHFLLLTGTPLRF